MEVKPGCKQTEVGVIPEDWEVVPLGTHFHFKNGLNKAKEFFGHGTPIVNYMDVFQRPSLRVGDILGCVDVSARERRAYEVRQGDVFFTRTSETVEEIGVASVMLDEAEDTVFSGFVLRARPTDEVLDDGFKGYCFAARYFRQQVTARASYTTRALTNGRSLSTALLAKPPLLEQRAIAVALSDVDALLGGLGRLIAKKRDLKQAAMQQLLTGQTRLPGFQGEWKPKTFGELLKYERPDKFLVNSTEYLEKGAIPVLTANKSFILGYTNDESGIYENLPVIIFDDFTTDSKYVEFPFKVKSSAIKILKARSTGVNLQFIFACMRLVDFPLGEHKRYYISEYQHIELPTPEPDEQTAIAEVLTEMDAELAALEQRREKTRDLKHAMMQELLTGKTRLV